MRIAVIGAGAMGSIYGGHLSLHNDVCMVDTNAAVVEHISKEGIILEENGAENLYKPGAVTSTEGMQSVDLIILFVKALFSKAALAGNPQNHLRNQALWRCDSCPRMRIPLPRESGRGYCISSAAPGKERKAL